ncbi:MAG: hypothetical protein A2046_10590 [Bacteroidetes bacterium GWA2_30_7]|nr:MAG: hypothetical protein A2046_10590 [Bacteroidetes bacterium GWA2_30_7]
MNKNSKNMIEFILYVIILGIVLNLIANLIWKYLPGSNKHIIIYVSVALIVICVLLVIYYRNNNKNEKNNLETQVGNNNTNVGQNNIIVTQGNSGKIIINPQSNNELEELNDSSSVIEIYPVSINFPHEKSIKNENSKYSVQKGMELRNSDYRIESNITRNFMPFSNDLANIYGKSLFKQIKYRESFSPFCRVLKIKIDKHGKYLNGEIVDYKNIYGQEEKPKYNIKIADNEFLSYLSNIKFKNIDSINEFELVFEIENSENNMVHQNTISKNGLQLTSYENTISIYMKRGRSFVLSNPTNKLIIVKEIRAVIDNYESIEPTHDIRGLVGEAKFKITISPTQKIYTFAKNQLKYSLGEADNISIELKSEGHYKYDIHFEVDWYNVDIGKINTIETLSDILIFDQ